MDQHFKTQEFKQNRTSNILVSALVMVVLFLAVVRVVIANVEVDASEKLKNLDKKIAVLEGANQLSSEKLRAKASLVKALKEASRQGFQKTRDYSFVEAIGPVAAVFDEFHN